MVAFGCCAKFAEVPRSSRLGAEVFYSGRKANRYSLTPLLLMTKPKRLFAFVILFLRNNICVLSVIHARFVSFFCVEMHQVISYT